MASKPQGSYQITIKAIDATTTVVAKINKGLFNQTKIFRDIGKSASGLGREFTRFGKLTGITFVAKQVQTLGGHLAKAAKSTLNFFDKLVSLSGLLTVGGIVAAIRQFSTYSKDLSNNARQIGITPKALQSWQKIGEYAAGISPETMTNNLQGLSKTIEDSIFGRDNEAASYFTKMGIQLTDVNGEAKDAGKVLDELRQKFNKMPEGPGKAAAKMELLNRLHLGADIEPFLHVSDRDMEEAKKEAAKYNNITEAGIAIAEKYRKSMVGVNFAIKDLSNAVAESLAPAFTELLQSLEPLVKSWGDWVRLHRDDIIKTTTEWVRDFVTWLKQIDFSALFTSLDQFAKWVLSFSLKDMIQSIKDLWDQIDAVAQGFGGWEKIGWAAIAVGVGLIASALSTISLPLIVALTAYMVAARLFKGAPEVPHDEFYRDLPTASHDWDSVPQSVQELYPNSPYNQHMSGGDRTFYERHGIVGMGGKPDAPDMKPDVQAASKESFDFWLGKGLSPAEAAAMASQEISESGGNAGARGDVDANGVAQAHGAYQWHAERRGEILRGTGIDVDSADIHQQREAAFWEYQHTHAGTMKDMFNAGQTPREKGEAAGSFEGFKDWDNPWSAERARRGALAEKIYNQNYPLATKKPVSADNPGTDDLPTVLQRLRFQNPKASVDVSFNGFPNNMFATQANSQNMDLNTSRTAGPVFAA